MRRKQCKKSPRRRRKEERRRAEAEAERRARRAQSKAQRQAAAEAKRRAVEAEDMRVRREVAAGAERARQLAGRGRRGRAGRRPRSPHKDLDRLVALAWQAGLRVEPGGSGHIKIFTRKRIVSVPMTPSRQRTLRRIRAELRQGGLEI